MSDVKYLSDGRKVAIIGKLNNNETIVQEIFVTNSGDEVPSGERFVVKSLHDEPVISYKDKEEARLAERIKQLEADQEATVHKCKEIRAKLKAHQEILASTSKFVDLLPENELEIFTGFITGSIEYLVSGSYGIPRITKTIDRIIDWDSGWGERRYDGIKLLSVLGRSEGKLEYKIHQYRDGSGSWDTCFPCRTLEEARVIVKKAAIELLEKERLTEEYYMQCLEMGVEFSDSENALYEAHRKASLEKRLGGKKEQLKTLIDEIASIEASLGDDQP